MRGRPNITWKRDNHKRLENQGIRLNHHLIRQHPRRAQAGGASDEKYPRVKMAKPPAKRGSVYPVKKKRHQRMRRSVKTFWRGIEKVRGDLFRRERRWETYDSWYHSAALKCRQRKKQWLNNLQSKVEYLTSDNERLQMQTEALREEVVNLKTLLMAHKDCPVAQANGFHPNAVQKSMPAMMPQQMMPSLYHPNPPSQPPQPQPAQQQSASSFARTSTSRPLPPSTATTLTTQAQFQPGMQPRMMAGGSTGVLRF